jgi:hypothetical protein
MFFLLRGIPIVDKGYLLAGSLLHLAEVSFISCFFRLHLLGLPCEGSLKFILSLGQLLFYARLLDFLVMEQLFSLGRLGLFSVQ